MSGPIILVAMFVSAVAIGLAAFVLLFKVGLFGQMDVLFYRGLVLLVLCGVVTFLAIALAFNGRVRLSDMMSGSVLSMSLNLAILVIFPVTIDRSISVFLLGVMANQPTQEYTEEELTSEFSNTYLGKFKQIDRRMHEQIISGNIVRRGGGYAITPQGQGFVRLARTIAWAFNTDGRFVEPKGQNHPPPTR